MLYSYLLYIYFLYFSLTDCSSARIFNCKQLRYAWNAQTQTFDKIQGLDVNISNAYFHQQHGLSNQEQVARRLVYGPNEITVPYKDVKTLLFLEVLNPFYVFQIFSVVLWFAYDYYYYACVIVLMSVFGITMSIVQTKKVRPTTTFFSICRHTYSFCCCFVFQESRCSSWDCTKYGHSFNCGWKRWSAGIANAAPCAGWYYRNTLEWLHHAMWCCFAVGQLYPRWSYANW